MKKNPRFLFWNTPSTCSLSGFNTWLTIKSLCDQEFCSASKMKLSGWWSLKIVWGISRDIHVCPWYFNAVRMMQFKNCVRNFQGYTCDDPGISIDFQMEKRRQHLRMKSVSFLLIFPRKKRRSINKYIFLAIYRYVEERGNPNCRNDSIYRNDAWNYRNDTYIYRNDT